MNQYVSTSTDVTKKVLLFLANPSYNKSVAGDLEMSTFEYGNSL